MKRLACTCKLAVSGLVHPGSTLGFFPRGHVAVRTAKSGHTKVLSKLQRGALSSSRRLQPGLQGNALGNQPLLAHSNLQTHEYPGRRENHGPAGWRIFTLVLRRSQPDLVTEQLQEAPIIRMSSPLPLPAPPPPPCPHRSNFLPANTLRSNRPSMMAGTPLGPHRRQVRSLLVWGRHSLTAAMYGGCSCPHFPGGEIEARGNQATCPTSRNW